MSRPMKDSGVEWIGEIPESWYVTRFKDVLYKKKEICKSYADEDILSLTMRGVIVRDLINPTGKMPATFDGYQYVEKGNLLLCLFDIDVTPRCVGVVKNNGLTSPAYSRYILRNQESLEYYNYLLTYLDDKKILLSFAKSLRNTLTDEYFGAVKTLLPPVHEQQKIAAFLDEKTIQIDAIIDNTKQSIIEFKKYKQALITETVTKGLNSDVKKKDSGIEWIGEIPEHWEIIKLKAAGNFYSAGVDKKVREGEGLYKSVHYTDVYYNSLKQIANNEGYLVISAKEDKARKSNLLKGDVLFTTSSETPEDIGHSAVVEEDLMNTLMGYHLIRFRANDEMVLSYEKYAFGSSHLRNWFAYRANGMTRYGLKVVDFLDAPYISIPQKEQQKIADFLDEKCAHIDNLIADKEILITELEDYKKALIYEYVTGKKEVE